MAVKLHSSVPKPGVLMAAAIVLVLCVSEQNNAQVAGSRQAPANQPQASDNAGRELVSRQGEEELRSGTDLTRRGLFR